jgi:phosphatidate cytidylyltransferase
MTGEPDQLSFHSNFIVLHLTLALNSLKEILVRTASGIVFLIIVIGSILIHPVAFLVVFAGFTVLGLKEYFELTTDKHISPLYLILGILLYFLIGLIGTDILAPFHFVWIILVLPLVLVIHLFEKKRNMTEIGAVFSGYFYVAVPFGLMNWFAMMSNRGGMLYNYLLISLFVIVWCNDIFAYLSGSFLGKHKLFERISPKKTWEGFVGGMIFALLAGYILSLFFHDLTLIQWLVLSSIIVVTGTLGDLSESMLKRYAGVKDSGSLMPGHGGVLDRFDAVLFATPFVLIYLETVL